MLGIGGVPNSAGAFPLEHSRLGLKLVSQFIPYLSFNYKDERKGPAMAAKAVAGFLFAKNLHV